MNLKEGIQLGVKLPLKFRRAPNVPDQPLTDQGLIIHAPDPELSEFKKKSVKHWMENYYRGYKKFKKGTDIRELVPKINKGGPAVIVGASPAIDDFKHIDMLVDSNFSGGIFATNKSFIALLDHDIIPDAVVGVESHEVILKSFELPLKKYPDICEKLPLVMGTTTYPDLMDLWPGPQYFFNIYHGEMVTYFMNEFSPHTTLRLCGDVGSTCWMVACMCNKDPIALIGMEFGYKDPLEETFAYKMYKKEGFEGDLRRFFRRDYNPFFKSERWVDSVFQGYLQAFLYVSSVTDVKTINCTGAGSIHNEQMLQMHFKDFLKEDRKKRRGVFGI